MRLLLLVLIVGVLVIPFSYSLTASIGNARMILRPVFEEGKTTTIDKSILVKNVNNISIKASLEPDDRYKKIIEIFDNEFILQPNESRNARFRITLKSGGRYEGKILVSFASADPSVKANSVGLSSTIIILAEGPVTGEYDKVMGQDAEDESVEEEIEEIEEDIPFENYEDIEENVSVSIGSAEPEIAEKEVSISPLIGILIAVGIIIVGLGVFFIVKAIK